MVGPGSAHVDECRQNQPVAERIALLLGEELRTGGSVTTRSAVHAPPAGTQSLNTAQQHWQAGMLIAWIIGWAWVSSPPSWR